MRKSKKIEKKAEDVILIFSSATEYIRLSAAAVVFIAGDGNYSTITTIDSSTYILSLQLGQIEECIPKMLVDEQDNRFLRIGKSFIINRDYVTLINPSQK